MGLSWLLLAMELGRGQTEFQIDTDTPDSLCPELSMTRDAVQKRLGKLEVEGGGIWRGHYGVVRDPSGRHGDTVRLVIVDPNGKEQASRDFSIRGESCATLAQAIALVVEGFFRDLGQSPSAEPSEVAPPVVAPPTQPTAPTAPTRLAPPDNASPKTQKKPVKSAALGVDVGSGYQSAPASLAVFWGLFVAVKSSWQFDLRVALPTSRVSLPFRSGSAELLAVPLRLSAVYSAALVGDLRAFAGPEFLTSFEFASTEGVSGGQSGWRASFGAGARAGAAFWFTPGLALGASFSGDGVFTQSRRFLLDSNSEIGLSRTRLAGALELSGVIFQ
jgi:hypothetical protein